MSNFYDSISEYKKTNMVKRVVNMFRSTEAQKSNKTNNIYVSEYRK